MVPRESPYRICLDSDHLNELQERARSYTSPYFEVLRAKIILLAAQGLSNKEIAQRLDSPRQVVSRWRKRFFEQGLAGLEDEPRGGRPAAFPPSRHR